MDAAWASLLATAFAIGEEHFKAAARKGEQVPFATADEQRAAMTRWLQVALVQATQRRRGDQSCIELSSGKLIARETVEMHIHSGSGQLLSFFDAMIQIQMLPDTAEGRRAADDAAGRLAASFLAVDAFRHKMAESVSLLQRMYCGPPAVTMNLIWNAFFSRVFSVAEGAVATGLLHREEVVDQEPWIYLGIPALTALHVVLRSIPQKQQAQRGSLSSVSSSVSLLGRDFEYVDDDAPSDAAAPDSLPTRAPFRLALGEVDVDESNCPAEAREMLAAFAAVRTGLVAAKPSPAEMKAVACAALYGDGKELPHDAANLRPELRRVVGGLQSIAICGTQFTEFKQHFDEVLQLLIAVIS